MKLNKECLNGRQLQVGSLPAALSLRIWSKIAKQHGGVLAEFFGIDDADSAAMRKAIGAICVSIEPDLLEEVRGLFASISMVDGQPIGSDAQFSAAFSGRIGDQLGWLRFCLASEFGHFFAMLSGADLGAPVVSAPSTPNT